jgi:putative ferrous iron transport protein C
MILSELAGYLSERGRAPLVDLATRFDTSPNAVRGMLATLERRGRVRRLANGAACTTGCTKCDQSQVESYEWVGRGSGRPPVT